MCIFHASVSHITHLLHHNLHCYMQLHAHIHSTLNLISLNLPKIPNDYCMNWLLSSFCRYYVAVHKRTLVFSCTEIIILYFNSSIYGSRQLHAARMSNWGKACFLIVVLSLVLMWCSNSVHLSPTESEPRDAGTDTKSSGIIRLHTIKQIIDRVRSYTCTHAFRYTVKR